jgi:TIGR03009 family protein
MCRRVFTVSLTALIALLARTLPAQAPPTYPPGGTQQAGTGYQQPGSQGAAPAGGQQNLSQPPGPVGGAHPFSGPTHPIVPNTPAAQRVIRPPVMRNAPFQLSREQYDALMAVLAAWERNSGQVDLLRCGMEILEYDLTFPITVPTAPGKPRQVNPNHVWQGELKYQAPDKGWFEAHTDNARQKWIVDGQSVYQFDYQASKVIRRDLPPELRGAGIGDGPLPFFFGAKADRLVRRYFMRLVTPAGVQRQVWIEAYPRFQFDAANFRRATIILDGETILPMAVEIYSPSGNERSVHKFSNVQIGRNLLEKLFNQNIFQVDVPHGWQMVVNPGAAAPRAAAAQPRGARR